MRRYLHILHLEDDPYDAELVQEMLSETDFPSVITRVDTRDDFIAAIDKGGFDLIFADNSIPSLDGRTALSIAQTKVPNVPFVFVSGTLGEEVAIESLQNGATDYVLKQRLSRLVPVVRRALREADERVKRAQAEATLRRNEELYRMLAQNFPDGTVFLFDQDLRFTLAEGAGLADLGLTKDGLEGRTISEVFPAATWMIMEPHYRAALAGMPSRFELDHSDRTYEVHTLPVRNDRGGIFAGLVVMQDISIRKQHERELEAVSVLSTALLSLETRDAVVPVILHHVLDLLHADGSALIVREPITGETFVESACGRWEAVTGVRNWPGEALVESVMTTGQPSITNNARSVDHVASPDGPQGLPALVLCPLIAHGDSIGVLAIGRSREITAPELSLLTVIAGTAASVLHRATVQDQTQRRLQRLAALRSIDLAITTSLDEHSAINILLDHVISQLSVDAAAVLRFDPLTQTFDYMAGRGFRTPGITSTHLTLGSGLGGRAALERRTIHEARLADSADFILADLLLDEEFTTYYGVPLIAKGEVKGVLEIFHRAQIVADPEWLDFLQTLAGQAAIALDNAELFANLQRSNADLIQAYDATIEGWSRALDLRDKETEGHCRRVTELTVQLARLLGVTERELVHIRRGALLHDIGKMGIPDAILLKPGPLTAEEWLVMRKHPDYAHGLLSPIPFLHEALDIPYFHHEKWDGTGYPCGLKGEQIPLAARIFTVVDVWDAMRANRPYREAWPEERVREHIEALTGTQFDPTIVELFLSSLANRL